MTKNYNQQNQKFTNDCNKISDEQKNFKNVPSFSVENLMKKNDVVSSY